MASLLVDTDVLVDHLRGFRAFDPGSDTCSCSVITRCELFAGRGGREAVLRALLVPFREIPVDRPIAERAGRIRRDATLRTPDALIAATAMQHRLTLLTRNTRDFERVAGLRLSRPE